MSTTSTKSELRKIFLDIRRAMDQQDVEKKSQDLCQSLLDGVDWENVKAMHCFLPLLEDNEPDLRQLISEVSKKKVAIYTSDPSPKTGRSVRSHQAVKEYSEEKIDLIIVPMLAGDPKTGHRLGFGGGFYDKLLASNPDALTIGVCFTECVTSLPSEAHDQPLDELLIA